MVGLAAALSAEEAKRPNILFVHETHNVANDPAYAEIRATLEAKLLAELKRTGDPRLENDGAYFETPPLSGPVR